MAGLVSGLIDTLDGQIGLYTQLVALLVRKKDLIITNDIENLRKLVAEENAIVPKVLRLDKEREKTIADICTVLGKKNEEMTLTYLSQLMQGQPEHEALVDVVARLSVVVDEMKTLNDESKLLIESALEYVNYNINVIHSTFAEAPAGYNPTLENYHEQKGFFDTSG